MNARTGNQANSAEWVGLLGQPIRPYSGADREGWHLCKWFKERHMGLGDMMDVPTGLPAKVHILPDTHLCTNQDEWLIFAPRCSYFSFLFSLFKKMSHRTTPGRAWRANSILGMAASDVVVWKRHHLPSQSPAVGRLGCLPPRCALFVFHFFSLLLQIMPEKSSLHKCIPLSFSEISTSRRNQIAGSKDRCILNRDRRCLSVLYTDYFREASHSHTVRV